MIQNIDDLNSPIFLDILESLTDPIYIADSDGITLWLNKASENFCGVTKSEVIGKNVRKLEAAGVFSPSIVRMTIEAGTTISTIVSSRSDQKFLATGHLIRDSAGNVRLVVSHSRDITEVVRTTSRVEEAEALLRHYSLELKKMKLKQRVESISNPLIGKSEAYQMLSDLIDKVGEVDTTILITGETGVGKTAIAKRIHQVSHRHDKPFIHINCGALPESLIESELFGYKKGAFTGANTSGKIGLVKAAEKGTLFLDEIGELPLHLQAKILQLIQEKTYMQIGDSQLHTADVRIITATNRNLLDMANENKFRADLYYRLNILPIHVPALRERQRDIYPLLSFALNKFNKLYAKNRTFSAEILHILQNHDWPGNIRELENLIERLIITAAHDEITCSDLPQNLQRIARNESASISIIEDEPLPDMLERIEKEIIKKMYAEHKTTRKTSKVLGITQSSLMRRLQKYNISLQE